MANAYCQDGYCDISHKEIENTKIPVNEKFLISGLTLFVAVISGILVWYGAVHGIYIDPLSLN